MRRDRHAQAAARVGCADDRWRALTSALVEGVVELDDAGRVVAANPAACALLGRDEAEALGRPLAEVVPLQEEWSPASALSPARPEVEGRLRSATGEVRLVRVRRRPHAGGEILVIEDRTQERKRGHRLAYADRLASGGALAAVRLGPVPDLLSAAPATAALEEATRRVRDAAAFLGSPVATEPADLADVVRWAADAVPRPPGVALEQDVPPGLRPELPAVALRQVVAGLLTNAVQAVGGAGTVWIRAARAGRTVELEVADDGRGEFPVNELAFQPYFSTVPGSHGLGLSVARDLVTEGGGVITLARTDRTRARVVLPATPTAEDPAGRLLVVDPELPVLRLCARVLRDAGVEVVGAAGGAAALRQVEEAGPFDAALCALELPDMDGAELCRALAHRAPALSGRIALVGGSEDVLAARRGPLQPIVGPALLVKPFTPDEVRRVVRALMSV